MQLGFPVRSVQSDQQVEPIIPAVQPQPKSLLEMCSSIVAKRCKLLEVHQLGLPKTVQERVEEIQLRERYPCIGLLERERGCRLQDLRPSIPAQDLRPSRSRSPVSRSRMRSRTQSVSSRTAVGSFRPRFKSLPPQLKQQV